MSGCTDYGATLAMPDNVGQKIAEGPRLGGLALPEVPEQNPS
jgi:hypothetical protein